MAESVPTLTTSPQPSAPLPAVLIEAFSDGPLAGNGAAVVLLEQPMAAAWMQGVAGSLKQSETAFLLQQDGAWLLRWFTPSCEVKLCGHATLASLLALGHWGRLGPGEALQLHSRSGPLRVERHRHQPWQGSLELPSAGLVAAPVPAGLEGWLRASVPPSLAATAVEPWLQATWESRLGYQVALLSPQAPLAQLEGLAERLEGPARQGLVLMQGPAAGSNLPLTAAGPADYQLRFFAPGLGIPEDPVTGSAHALVAPWWMEQLGRPQVRGWQCSPRPGGMLCERAPSGMIRLNGAGHLLWDGTLQAGQQAAGPDDCRGWALQPAAAGSTCATTPC